MTQRRVAYTTTAPTISVRTNPDRRRALKAYGVQHDATINDLMNEAIDLLAAKYGITMPAHQAYVEETAKESAA